MDHLSSSTANLFSSVTIDRAPEYRLNSEELSVLADSTNARFLPVLDSQVLVSNSPQGYPVATLTRSPFDREFQFPRQPTRHPTLPLSGNYLVVDDDSVQPIGRTGEVQRLSHTRLAPSRRIERQHERIVGIGHRAGQRRRPALELRRPG